MKPQPADENASKQVRWQRKQKREGRCQQCGTEAVPGKGLCQRCRKLNNRYYRKVTHFAKFIHPGGQPSCGTRPSVEPPNKTLNVSQVTCGHCKSRLLRT